MLVDPWSVSPETLDVVAAQFFAGSLLPYLAFLYFLSRERVACPPLANFGFRFLLVFVFATIPAGIYAKTHYHDILANIDWLHGGAESLLTLTNLFITLGFRQALSAPAAPAAPASDGGGETKLNGTGLGVIALGALAAVPGLVAAAALHVEPSNALSLPTWVIHVSSLVEWLVAMRLVWEYAAHTGNPRWRGLVWGMLPLHASGVCACTFHLFYNAPGLNALVAVQAALTAGGNATMAAAAYRLAKSGGSETPMEKAAKGSGEGDGAGESDAVFVGKMLVGSLVASAVVKWGSLAVEFPFEARPAVAVGLIAVPTAVNALLWAARSGSAGDDFGPSWL